MNNRKRFFLFRRPWLLFWWLLIALISTTGLYMQQKGVIGWWQILPVKLAVWLFWGLYAVLIFRLARRFAWHTGRWWQSLGFHFPFSLLSVLINVCFYSWIVYLLDLGGMGSNGLGTIFLLLLPALFEWYFILYWAIVIFTFAFDYFNKFRDQELQNLELEKRLIQAQLQTLKMQLHPHFLFNTLNTIVAQVRMDQKATAVNMLSGLSELLRTTLKHRDRQLVPLEEEMSYVKQYLDLEKERFGDRLQVHFEVGPLALQVPVPSFLLQPIVENAIYHGFAKRLDARHLRIEGRVYQDSPDFDDSPDGLPGFMEDVADLNVQNEMLCSIKEGQLQLSIYNDGPALAENFDPAYYSGIGLSNTIERLSQFYGADFDFSIMNADSGVCVQIILPQQLPPDE